MNTSPATDNKFGEVLSTKEYQAKKVRCPMNKSSAYGDLYNWSVTDPTSFWQGASGSNLLADSFPYGLRFYQPAIRAMVCRRQNKFML